MRQSNRLASRRRTRSGFPILDSGRTSCAGPIRPLRSTVTVSGTVGSSPLVVATAPSRAASIAAAAKTGWAAVLMGPAVVAVPDPLTTTEGALSALAVQSAVGSAPGLVGHVGRCIWATGDDCDSSRRADWFTAMQSSPVSAPAFVASEQDVVQANRGKKAPMVSAVYPAGRPRCSTFRSSGSSCRLPTRTSPRPSAVRLPARLHRSPVAYSEAGLRADPRLPLGAGRERHRRGATSSHGGVLAGCRPSRRSLPALGRRGSAVQPARRDRRVRVDGRIHRTRRSARLRWPPRRRGRR